MVLPDDLRPAVLLPVIRGLEDERRDPLMDDRAAYLADDTREPEADSLDRFADPDSVRDI